ncbi:MAG: hypothetical protein H0V37_03230 [Chloroflexia bacterium]|jgi:hypothetical protein|nr:hypothetical protein [Chloroflexia bacterium]
MNRRWIFAALFLLTLGVITAAVFWAPGRDWDRRDNRVEVVRVVDTGGNAVEAGSTIVVEPGHGGFPFGLLLIPLFLLLIFGFLRGGYRGPTGGDPWGPGGGDRAQWLDDWHARQHRAMAPAEPSTPSDPS